MLLVTFFTSCSSVQQSLPFQFKNFDYSSFFTFYSMVLCKKSTKFMNLCKQFMKARKLLMYYVTCKNKWSDMSSILSNFMNYLVKQIANHIDYNITHEAVHELMNHSLHIQ